MVNKFHFVAILFSVLCALAIPVNAKNTQANCKTILVVGDSLSAAHNLSIEQGWVSLLQKRLQQHKPQYCAVNASVGGDTTQEALGKLPNIIKTHSPWLVIIELGGNDGLRGLSAQNMAQNLSAMIEQLQQDKIKVLLVGVRLPPNYGPDYIEQFVSVYPRLAKKYQVALVPRILAGVADKPEYMQMDGVHPTASAQPLVLENVWRVLAPMLRRQ